MKTGKLLNSLILIFFICNVCACGGSGLLKCVFAAERVNNSGSHDSGASSLSDNEIDPQIIAYNYLNGMQEAEVLSMIIQNYGYDVKIKEEYTDVFIEIFSQFSDDLKDFFEVYSVANILYNLSQGNWVFLLDAVIYLVDKIGSTGLGLIFSTINLFDSIYMDITTNDNFEYITSDGDIITKEDISSGHFLDKAGHRIAAFGDMLMSWFGYIAFWNIDLSTYSNEEKFWNFLNFNVMTQQQRQRGN